MESNNNSGGKPCSVCGEWYPSKEYYYGNQSNRSYCLVCRKEYRAAYRLGGKEETKKYLGNKRATWKLTIL
jgi:CRISPR/Cas system-associated protein Cas10 (large subunit of type III CRISPR-Cas system)